MDLLFLGMCFKSWKKFDQNYRDAIIFKMDEDENNFTIPTIETVSETESHLDLSQDIDDEDLIEQINKLRLFPKSLLKEKTSIISNTNTKAYKRARNYRKLKNKLRR